MKEKKVIRFSVKVLLLIFSILIAGYFILNEVARRKILSELNKTYPSVKIEVMDAHVSLLRESVSLDSLKIYFPSFKNKRGDISHCYIPKTTIKGISFLQFVLHKQVVASVVTIQNAEILLDSSLISKKDSLLKQINSPIKKLTIRHLNLRDASVVTNSFKADATISIDELTSNALSSNKKLRYKSIQCRLSDIDYTLPNGLHALRIKELEVDSKKQSVVLEQIRLEPMFSREKFFSRLGHQADRIDGKISKVEIVHIDIPALMEKKLIAEKIVIHSASVHVFRDRRYPRPEKNIPMPMQGLRAAPFDINVKSVQLNPSLVEYEEQAKEGDQTGTLRIEQLKISISPFVNHFHKSDPDYLKMKTEGSVEGTGTVQATVMMPLKQGMPYLVKGVFNNLDLTKLNASSENLGKIRIKSGFLDFLYFDFSMSEKVSTGKIVGAYHRLIIQQLKKHTNEKKVVKFSSFMLRNFIIPLNKPASLPERKRTGEVHYKRDPSRFFSYYLLQSLLTGVKKSFILGFLLPK